ncbi:MAG: ABC transporter ATP-binding protein [Acidimicrobiaceae bacterium]|nr:ABC transporter ATP-binding protein [Acidimicrobiaceae bacterium]
MTAVEPLLGSAERPTSVATPQLARYVTPQGRPDPDASKGWLRRLWPVVAPMKWGLAVAVGGTAAGMLVRTVIPAVLMLAVDNALDDRTAAIGPYAWGLAALTIIGFATGYAARVQMFKVAFRVETALRHAVFDHLSRLSASFYDTSETGQLLARANGDIRAVQMFLNFGPFMALSLAFLVFALALMLAVSVPLTLVTVLPVPVVAYIGLKSRHPQLPVWWLVMARQADVATLTEENIAGVRVVKSFAGERHEVRRMAGVADQLRWAQVKGADVSARYIPALEHLPRLGLVVVLLYGGLLAEQEQIGIGALIAFSSYVMILQVPFRFIGHLIQMGQRAKASALRVYEIFDQPIDVVESPDAVDVDGGPGRVEFRDVRFGYGADHDVLQDFSLDVAPGETVAIVGETASGKSTVARLLPRFYDVRDGSVQIDGTDIRQATLDSLRRTVGVVLDDPFLFSMSVRDNIAFADPTASDESVRAAAAAAQALEFIEELEHGFDEVLGERGYTLSGGQRQRISLARALLHDPQILVLDDATSAIDAGVEERIHSALRHAMVDRTVIVIAHRLSTIALADRVVLLERGRVVASGTHADLLVGEPKYRELLEHFGDQSGDESDNHAGAGNGADPGAGNEIGFEP